MADLSLVHYDSSVGVSLAFEVTMEYFLISFIRTAAWDYMLQSYGWTDPVFEEAFWKLPI